MLAESKMTLIIFSLATFSFRKQFPSSYYPDNPHLMFEQFYLTLLFSWENSPCKDRFSNQLCGLSLLCFKWFGIFSLTQSGVCSVHPNHQLLANTCNSPLSINTLNPAITSLSTLQIYKLQRSPPTVSHTVLTVIRLFLLLRETHTHFTKQ